MTKGLKTVCFWCGPLPLIMIHDIQDIQVNQLCQTLVMWCYKTTFCTFYSILQEWECNIINKIVKTYNSQRSRSLAFDQNVLYLKLYKWKLYLNLLQNGTGNWLKLYSLRYVSVSFWNWFTNINSNILQELIFILGADKTLVKHQPVYVEYWVNVLK